jgi:aminoglycoside phosphotransferase (APT) family kinase protein
MTSSEPPGRLIGTGRAADVYELDGDRVLRRYRVRASVEHEARLMEYLYSVGFPVPEVFQADGKDLVMARVVGTDMLTELGKRPWKAWQYASTLAAMHDRLHEIEAPPWLRRPLGDGDRVVHFDLHPGNVMLTKDGPVVIDWSNGSAGPPGADVAMASLIMRVSEVGDLPFGVRLAAGLVRDSLVRRFERAVSADAGPYLARMAKARMADRNVRPSEIVLLQQIIDTRS